jgi:hypothetical protein
MYKFIKPFGTIENIPDMIQRISDGAFIPFNPLNTHYQEYLKWIAEGNTPEPADEPEGE